MSTRKRITEAQRGSRRRRTSDSSSYDVHRFVDDLLGHFMLEESEFSSGALLRDDPTTVEFGG